jgi:hypothetical protein
MRRWRNGKRGRLLSDRSGFDSPAAYARSCSVGGTANSPGSQPGDSRVGTGTEHSHSLGTRPESRGRPPQSPNCPSLSCADDEAGRSGQGGHGPIVYGLRSRPFKSRNGVRLPVGLQRVAAPVVLNGLIIRDRWVRLPHPPRWPAARQGRKRTAKRGNSFWCRSTAGRCPVKAAIGVRIPAPERSCGVTDITPGYGPGEWGFDSLREYASAVSSTEERRSYKPMIGVRLPDCVRWLWCSGSIGGRGPPGPGSVPGDHPKGVPMWRRTSDRKSPGSACEGSTPSAPTLLPEMDSFPCVSGTRLFWGAVLTLWRGEE